MMIHEHPLSWYTDKLATGESFSMGMYGDGEWMAIFQDRVGQANAEDTVFTPELCRDLRKSLEYTATNYYYSTPEVLRSYGTYGRRIDQLVKIEFVEKDFWDVAVRTGKLIPFIKQLQGMKTCIISNKALRNLHFLKYDQFIEVSYPNCFDEFSRVMQQVYTLGPEYVYLVSVGLPAAILTQEIHATYQDVFALDLGSIWDAFVGIGGQRGWRAELYADPVKYEVWKSLYKEVM